MRTALDGAKDKIRQVEDGQVHPIARLHAAKMFLDDAIAVLQQHKAKS